MKASPLLSLLIATVRRRTELERLLFSLRQQKHTCLQIIIADQNPPDFLVDVYAEFTDLPLQVISAPDKGVSQARNAILPLAKGDYIVFPDDDCWYAPDTLAQAVEAFRRHPEAGAVLGYWTPSPQFPQPDNTEQVLSATALFAQGGTWRAILPGRSRKRSLLRSPAWPRHRPALRLRRRYGLPSGSTQARSCLALSVHQGLPSLAGYACAV